MVACLLPALVFSAKHLHKDTVKKLKDMIIKWAKATFYVAFAGTVPWIMICCGSRMNLIRPGYYLPQTIAYTVAMLGIFVEPLSKHSQYVGFYVPKCIEAFTNAFVKIKVLRQSKIRTLITAFLVCGAIGVAHDHGHYEKVDRRGD